MKVPYKLEPRNAPLVPLDHEQFVVGHPEQIQDLVLKIKIRTDADQIRTDALLGNLMADKKMVEERFKEPVGRAHKRNFKKL